MEKYQPKISVIIPVYGVEKYIRQCLESIINQTYKNLEIIVVNDGTKDNSMKIVEEYLSDERIKIINKQNGGLSSARNRGIEEATGDYISFIDSDDWIDLNMYKELCSQLIDEDILIYRFFNYDNKKNEIMEEKKVSKYQVIENYIIENIHSNIFKADDILPTESELAEKFSCSRVTVRQALSNLTYKGIIYRIQGKGSFVSKEHTLKRSPLLKSFTEDMIEMGKKPWSIVEKFQIIKAGEHIGRIMGLKPTDNIYYIERLRFADNDPLLFEKTYMEVSKHPEMSVKILEGSKYEYAKKHGMEISISYQNIAPVFAPEKIAEKLKISSKTPILKLSNITYLKNGELFDYNELYMNTELYQLDIVKKVEK